MTADSDDSDLPPLARRVHERKRTLLRGVIVHSDGLYSIDCTIRDISENGARIQLPAAQIIPSSLYLINVSNHIAHLAEMKRYVGKEAGLLLLNSLDLEGAIDPKLSYLQRIYKARAVR